jgi:hypothetical protein
MPAVPTGDVHKNNSKCLSFRRPSPSALLLTNSDKKGIWSESHYTEKAGPTQAQNSAAAGGKAAVQKSAAAHDRRRQCALRTG